MNGVEVRVVQLHSRDTDLGTEGADTENAGAVELWRDGKRIAELVWWEKLGRSIKTLEMERELNAHLTYSSDIHCRVSAVRP